MQHRTHQDRPKHLLRVTVLNPRKPTKQVERGRHRQVKRLHQVAQGLDGAVRPQSPPFPGTLFGLSVLRGLGATIATLQIQTHWWVVKSTVKVMSSNV